MQFLTFCDFIFVSNSLTCFRYTLAPIFVIAVFFTFSYIYMYLLMAKIIVLCGSLFSVYTPKIIFSKFIYGYKSISGSSQSAKVDLILLNILRTLFCVLTLG